MSVEQVHDLHFGSLDAPPSADVLRRCQGFLVRSTDGRVGVAQTLRGGRRRPSSLPVLAGRRSGILLMIALEEIQSIFFAERRIVIRTSAKIVATERLGCAKRRQTEVVPST